jgi:hypothetical protein
MSRYIIRLVAVATLLGMVATAACVLTTRPGHRRHQLSHRKHDPHHKHKKHKKHKKHGHGHHRGH